MPSLQYTTLPPKSHPWGEWLGWRLVWERVNKGRPFKWEQTEVTYSEPGSLPPPRASGRDSQVGRGVGRLSPGNKRERVGPGCDVMEAVAWDGCRRPSKKWGILHAQLGG